MSKFGTLVAVRGGEVPLSADGAPTAIQVRCLCFSGGGMECYRNIVDYFGLLWYRNRGRIMFQINSYI